MKLDNEQQRQALLQVINSIPIQGNLQQVTQLSNALVGLAQAVERAGIEMKARDEEDAPGLAIV